MQHIIILFFLYVIGVWAEACGVARVRKEWRTLSTSEKANYIAAVQCLWTLPAKGGATFPVITRHDDFAANHVNATGPIKFDSAGNIDGVLGPGIHFVGVFLPWHRYLLWVYETTLRNECNYNGTQPYWDWSLDVPENNGAQFNASPIFDPITGFGGNGANGSIVVTLNVDGFPNGIAGNPIGSCINNGPFANRSLVLNPGPPTNGILTSGNRCLVRNFQPGFADASLAWKANVQQVLNFTDYPKFTAAFDALPPSGLPPGPGLHGGGHIGVAGEMLNTWSSINDPLFYMHHANLDRIWSIWQKQSPDRLYAHGGPIWPLGSNHTGNVTLDSPMYMFDAVAPTLPIRTVQDTLNQNGKGILCYVYEDDFELYKEIL